MATVVAITFVRRPCLELILFIRFRRRSPDKHEPARPPLDSTPEGTSVDTWTTGGSAERSMGAAFGLRALTHLSRPPQAIRGFVRLGLALVCIRQVRN